MGKPDSFIDQVEQVLRGTLGFDKLRLQSPALANKLLGGIQDYANYMSRPNQPLKLVDSTGFSLQSINTVLKNKGNIKSSSWNTETLFSESNKTLQDMMGILLRVPELRDNLKDVTGGELPDGQKLALIIKDWVNGEAVNDIATNYFMDDSNNSTKAMTKCGQNLFGKLTHTASWGLGALLSITAGDLPEEEFKELSNLPSRVYYGANDDSAIALRLLGIPRTAAMPMAISMADVMDQPLPKIRDILSSLPENKWEQTLGEQSGKVYRKVWRILEGLE